MPCKVAAWTVVAMAIIPGVAAQGTVVPGAREILALDFANTAVGAFPKQLGYQSGSLEVVEKNGVHMLKASLASTFVIPLPETLPEAITLEFDLIPKESRDQRELAFGGGSDLRRSTSSTEVIWSADMQQVIGGGQDFHAATPPSLRDALSGQLSKIIASFDGGTLKLYTNGERLYTLSDTRFARGQALRAALGGIDEKQAVYLARVRVAAGAATVQQTVIAPNSRAAESGPVVTTQSAVRNPGVLANSAPPPLPPPPPPPAATTPPLSPPIGAAPPVETPQQQ